MIGTIDGASRLHESEDVCRTVVTEVAAAKGEPPEELDETLYDVVDPDALARLFDGGALRTDRRHCQVEFHFAGCRVTVRGPGDVSVSLLDDLSASTVVSGAAVAEEEHPT